MKISTRQYTAIVNKTQYVITITTREGEYSQHMAKFDALLETYTIHGDPIIEDQYYIFLTDQDSGEVVSDQVLFTLYKNGTATCGYALLDELDNCGSAIDEKTQLCHENACYKMVEEGFNAQIAALKGALEAEAAAQNQTVEQ